MYVPYMVQNLEFFGQLEQDYLLTRIGHFLQHSPECPLWRLHQCSTPATPSQERGIYVGVAVLVESFDSHVLMTQRSDHMRSFPRAWVPPGGHLGL